MCPIKDCNLKHYRTNQQIYDQVNSRVVSPTAYPEHLGIKNSAVCLF